ARRGGRPVGRFAVGGVGIERELAVVRGRSAVGVVHRLVRSGGADPVRLELDIGPWADAAAKVGVGTDGALAGLVAHLAEWGPGSVSETADGDPPHGATGCPFQAWSVAEVLRAPRRLFPVTPTAGPIVLRDLSHGED